HQLGTLLLNEGKSAEALPHLQRACLLKPADARLQNNCGAALLALGRADEAAEFFRAAVNLEPKLAQAHVALGQIDKAGGRPAEAIGHFRQAIELKHDHPVNLASLAWLLATAPDPKLRDGPLAVRLAEEACRRTSRRNADCLDALSAAYAEVGRVADAVGVACEGPAAAAAAGRAERG